MKLHEYQAKQLFARYRLPVPAGMVCGTVAEVVENAEKLGDGPWVVKCQAHTGGRGKSGGVTLAKTKQEIQAFAQQWLGQRLVTYQTDGKGLPVNQLLIETATSIERELYLGAVIDRSARRVVFMASTEGGVDIERVAQETPQLIHKVALDPLTGPMPFQGRDLAFKLGLQGDQVAQFTAIFMGLARLFLQCDLSLVEVNPLVVTSGGELMCLDGKIDIDNNALFRQPALREMRDSAQEEAREANAAQWGLNYVALDGNIGCMVNGAGLAMGTMDIVKWYGGKPANFLDVGGGATAERVSQAFKLILADEKVKAVFVNIFGGIVRCDLIADGIINAVAEVGVNVPVVVRLEGNHADIAVKKLDASGLNIIGAASLADAAQRVVALANEEESSCRY